MELERSSPTEPGRSVPMSLDRSSPWGCSGAPRQSPAPGSGCPWAGRVAGRPWGRAGQDGACGRAVPGSGAA